jgi:hypothetical protein
MALWATRACDVLSLPPVLLVWGIIAFAVGFIAYTAQDLVGDSGTGEWDAAWIALGISFFILIVVVIGPVRLASMWKNGAGQVFGGTWSRGTIHQMSALTP